VGKLIIIRGPAAVGKTTIVKALAKRLRGIAIHLDVELEQRGLDTAGDHYCIPVENFLEALRVLRADLQYHLASGTSVIIDGCFYHEEMLDYLDERVDAPTTVYTLHASLETCITRDRERGKPIGEESIRAVHKLASRVAIGTTIDTEGRGVEKVIEQLMQRMTE